MIGDLPLMSGAMGEETSDSENRNPTAFKFEIETDPKEFKNYRRILAPKATPKPTRQEERSARRCMRSGMVPGAIRKYLIQKKKQQNEDDEGGDEELSSGSATPPTSPSSIIFNNNNNDEPDEIDDFINDDNLLFPFDDDVDVDMDVGDDQELLILEEFSNNNGEGNILAEIDIPDPEDPDPLLIQHHHVDNPLFNRAPGHAPEENQNRDSVENDTLDSDDETDFEEEAEAEAEVEDNEKESLEVMSKRTYTEAFSPDSTTPEDFLLGIQEKRARVEATPVQHQKQMMRMDPPEIRHKMSRDSPDQGIQSPVPGTSGYQNLHWSFRRNSSSGSSNSSVEHVASGGSNSSQVVRNIFPESPPSSPQYSQSSTNSNLETMIRKNNWKGLLFQFRRDLDNKKIPSPMHVGDLIRKAILCIGTRVSKDIPAQAIEFFNSLVAEYPVKCDQSTKYYLSSFTKSTAEDCTMPEFLFMVLEAINSDVTANVTPKALPFFKTLTKMVVNQYKSYTNSDFKLRPPFFVRFLEEADKILSYNVYCQKLLGFMFSLKDYHEEFKLVARWIGLLSHHFQVNTQLDTYFLELVDDFVNNVSKSEFTKCRDTIIQSIADTSLGAAVCVKLLRQKLKFEYTHRHPLITFGDPTDDEVKMFLKNVSGSESIKGLKCGLQEKERSDDVTGTPTLTSAKDKNKRRKGEGVNMKGETHLHRLCRKLSSEEHKNNFGLELDKFLKERRFNVNPKDNFGNTPLHDAIAHGRYDAVAKFSEYCSNLSLPQELKVDILAQNEAGETAFHLAAVATPAKLAKTMVIVLRDIAENLQVFDEALKMLNSDGKMPYQLAYDPETRKLLKPRSVIELPYEVRNVRVDIPSRIKLQSIDVKKLIALWSEFSSPDD